MRAVLLVSHLAQGPAVNTFEGTGRTGRRRMLAQGANRWIMGKLEVEGLWVNLG